LTKLLETSLLSLLTETARNVSFPPGLMRGSAIKDISRPESAFLVRTSHFSSGIHSRPESSLVRQHFSSGNLETAARGAFFWRFLKSVKMRVLVVYPSMYTPPVYTLRVHAGLPYTYSGDVQLRHLER